MVKAENRAGEKMKRIVGIKYATEGLTEAALTEWLFDNIGEVSTSISGTLIAADHVKGITFNFAQPEMLNRKEGRLRIASSGEHELEEAWARINSFARRIAVAAKCTLTTEAHDLWEQEPDGFVQLIFRLCTV